MDICGPIRIASVNGKKYILVIVDDYSRFTWVKCVRSKDEAPDFIIKFLKMIQVRLKVPVRRIRTDNRTEFVNQTLGEYYEKVGISYETFVARSSQQNGVIERRNRTLIEVACTMLIYAKAPLFLWAEAVATAYFDELTVMASEHNSSGPALHEMTPVTISSGLMPNPPPSTSDRPTPKVISPIAEVVASEPAVSTGSPSSTTVDQDAPSPSNSQTTSETQSPIIPNDVEEDYHDIEVAHMGNDYPRGIFINQSKYALESLKKYDFDTCDPMDTPMVEKSKLDEDKEGKAVDPSHYHVSSIPGIVDAYLANKMHEADKTVVQLQSERLRDEAQAENADFLNKHDDNIKKIIKDQVKEHVKAQVSKIFPKIEKTVNEQLKAEVLTLLSNESKTYHAIAANLSELELKKILIDKMESNKRRDDEDKDEEPSTGSNRGSKRRRAGKEPESTSAPKEKTSKTTRKSTKGPNHITTKPPTHNHDWNKTLPEAHGPVQPWLSSLAQIEDSHKSFNELMDTPLDFSAFMMNRLKVNTLTPKLLVGPTFELMKGSCKSLIELEYFFEEVYKATTDQLD
ncbi:retrovirus-related pol polyprotein from transposon TNT 1-94 [Tanacetum coccineum]